MEIVEKRIRERNSIINQSGEYAKSLDFKCTVILIGSYARGDFNLWSDIDILIVGNFDSTTLYEFSYSSLFVLSSLNPPFNFQLIFLHLRSFQDHSAYITCFQ